MTDQNKTRDQLLKELKSLRDRLATWERRDRRSRSTGDVLGDSEKTYMTLVENSLTGIYVEQGGKIVFANNKCSEIYGFSKDGLLGMESWRLVHPEDRKLVEETVAKRLMGQDVPPEYDIRSLTKDGRTIWIRRRNTRIEYQGTPAILGNIVEITQQKLIEKKERIIETMFQKLGNREGVRLKDLFTLLVPELADVMKIQSCALFSINPDRTRVTLDAGYPEKGGYHGVGKVFAIDDEPYFNAIIYQQEILGEYEDEKIYPSYILVKNPRKSRLLTEDLRRFVTVNNINSILYVPLKTQGTVNFFLAFDALDQHTSFTKDEIELLVFFGKELMKAARIEQLDDIVHDFRNPAIAAAGFARRVQRALGRGQFDSNKKDICRNLEVLVRETSRLEDMAISSYGGGRETELDIADKLARRLEINREAIQELKRRDILIMEELAGPIKIRCYPLHIERVFDNLLSNATNAIPEDGGKLIVKSYPHDQWAVVEITNTGMISEFQREQILSGETKGRGLHIVNRLLKIMGGHMELKVRENQTTFTVYLPRIID